MDVPRIVGVRSSDTFKGDDWIGLKLREASVVRGIGVLPMFAGLLGLLLLVGSLALTWGREGRGGGSRGADSGQDPPSHGAESGLQRARPCACRSGANDRRLKAPILRHTPEKRIR